MKEDVWGDFTHRRMRDSAAKLFLFFSLAL